MPDCSSWCKRIVPPRSEKRFGFSLAHTGSGLWSLSKDRLILPGKQGNQFYNPWSGKSTILLSPFERLEQSPAASSRSCLSFKFTRAQTPKTVRDRKTNVWQARDCCPSRDDPHRGASCVDSRMRRWRRIQQFLVQSCTSTDDKQYVAGKQRLCSTVGHDRCIAGQTRLQYSDPRGNDHPRDGKHRGSASGRIPCR